MAELWCFKVGANLNSKIVLTGVNSFRMFIITIIAGGSPNCPGVLGGGDLHLDYRPNEASNWQVSRPLSKRSC